MSADNPTTPAPDRNLPEFWLWLERHGWRFSVEIHNGVGQGVGFWFAVIETADQEMEAYGYTPLQALVEAWKKSQNPGDPPAKHAIACPDCGPVKVRPVAWDNGRPVAGKCPKCRETLYFA